MISYEAYCLAAKTCLFIVVVSLSIWGIILMLEDGRRIEDKLRNEEPTITHVSENRYQISFNSYQRDSAGMWLRTKKYKVISIAFSGRNGDTPVYIVEK